MWPGPSVLRALRKTPPFQVPAQWWTLAPSLLEEARTKQEVLETNTVPESRGLQH